MEYLAHIRIDHNNSQTVQTAAEHCQNTATYAQLCLSDIGLGDAGYLAGLLHDCGKFKEEFLRYLNDPNGVRGSVNHTFAGCRLLLEQFHGESPAQMEDLTAELLAIAVASHHGLFDCLDEMKQSGLLHRMTKEDISFSESKHNFFAQCTSAQELSSLFTQAHQSLCPVYEKLTVLADENYSDFSFYLGLLSRLLLSAVIEGDRRDTAEFMCCLFQDNAPADLSAFWLPYLQHAEQKIAEFPKDSPVCRARAQISDQCRAFAEHPGGVYRLNVPTGSGKTLSSLRYALAHAQKWGKRRLIFTSPLLSILEQNAAVLREYLNDDSIILEHHSNVMKTEEQGALDPHELASDNWNSPVIITTLVQLLNTLFDGRTTAIRRFQALCNSVIIIDEVQTVPPKMLTLFNLAINFLAEVCDATVLLCSATQPCLEQTDHPLRCCKGDLVPYDTALWEPFRRTVITDAGSQTFEQIVEFTQHTLEECRSLLVVCNKKDEAEQLFLRLRDHAEVSCHLSATMCIAHRRKTLEELNSALQKGKKTLCVATQVIEAGVDISFDRVIRFSAGMDSVIQSAGRCNRHGERGSPSPVYIVQYLGENLGMLREIREAKAATQNLLEAFRKHPDQFEGDLSSDSAIQRYYQNLYHAMPAEYQDFSISKKKTSIFDLLSNNISHYDPDSLHRRRFFMAQAFRQAGSLFQVFETNTLDLVVPYEAGEDLILELSAKKDPSPEYLHNWLQRAKPYSISVYDYQHRLLADAITEYSGISVLSSGFYDEHTGLTISPKTNDFLEV